METKVMKITWTIAALACSVSLVSAQQPPRAPKVGGVQPAPAPKARVPLAEPLLPGIDWIEPPMAPMAAMEPLMPSLPMEPMLALPMVPMAPTTPMPPMELMAPMAPLPSMGALPAMEATPTPAPLPLMAPSFFEAWPQGGVTPRPASVDRVLEAELRRLTQELDRNEAARRRALEAQDRSAQRELELQQRNLERELEQQTRALDRAREQLDRQVQREIEQSVRQQEMQERQVEREIAALTKRSTTSSFYSNSDFRVTVPPSWAPQDVADSVWRNARELLNRGEWGQAAQAFRSIPQRYQNSEYAPEAAYYQAFALFRIGGTSELREALQVLDASRTKYPNARSKGEAASLATRIRGVLASRGDAEARNELSRTASEQSGTCDREEQAVQQEAMNQLSRMEGANINDLINRVLARKDECAIPLRRTAVFLVGNRRDAQAVSILSGVARNDPSVDVRAEAIGVIGRLPNEEGVTVLEELTRADDERIQRTAIRALVRHPSARARASVRGLVERDDISERVRSEALGAFDAERATADDVAWLRALYAKSTSPSMKTRTLSAIVRVGGPEVDQWLVTLARDDNQPSEIRATAMRRIGDTMSIADLGRLYDSATNRRFRAEVISALGKRKEDAATDKLIDIIKNGTDPQLRTAAINAVVSKNDARAQQLLLEIINK